jgi:hypothetical protein
MAKPIAIRRAAVYRQRALEHSETARQERRADVYAGTCSISWQTYRRAADQMATAS